MATNLKDNIVSTDDIDPTDIITVQENEEVKYMEARQLAMLRKKTTVTSAQLLALNATPITLVEGLADSTIIVHNVTIAKAAGTAYDGIAAGEDLAVKYTDGSGAVIATIETTGFLDQTTKEIRTSASSAISVTTNIEPVEEADIVLHLLVGEIATGDSDLEVFVDYSVLKTA